MSEPKISVLRLNPYRLFFPLGILFALIGVGEWVLWSVGWSMPAVSLTHTSLQAQGFLACFVVGFLMTAFPRFTGTDPVELGEIIPAFLWAAAFFVTVLTKHFNAAETAFIFFILTLIGFAARRLPKRSKPLPPSFLLMGFGFLHALTGPVLMILSGLGEKNLALFTVGKQMVQLGFLLCMVLGITGQLAPFLMGYTVDPGCDEDVISRLRSGRPAYGIHALAGALIYLSFWLIPFHERLAFGIRAAVVTFHLLTFARMARPVLKKTALIYFFTTAMWMIAIGLWATFLFPRLRIAMLHMVFIGGYSLMIFSFGQLIVLSHSLQAKLLVGRLIPMKIVGVSVLLAMGMRMAADVFPSHYMILIHLSSGTWVLAATFWLGYLWPKMFGKEA